MNKHIESQIKCRFCSTFNPESNEKCSSCGAPLSKRSNLSDKDRENLSNYIKSIDNFLNFSKAKADKKIGFYFIALSIIAVVSIILFYFAFFEKHQILFWLVSIIWPFILFIIFGFAVTTLENSSIKREFDTIIKFEINEYLKEMNYTNADFKTVATAVLNEKSQLIKFISDF